MAIEKLGPYRIVQQIGKGGMGVVYEAVNEKPGEFEGTRAAVKALSPQLAMDEGFRERFEAEIDSLKKLDHRGIVRLFGYGEQDGILFYSMELVEGTSLEEEISAGRLFDWRETIQIGIQVCRALKHAHDHGVVHRDIKPANLLLTPDSHVKIADFGIARLFGGTQLTTSGGVLGTADYMSPEQADGMPVTERCDQYSLGGVLYALLAGLPPFRAKTMRELLQLQRFANPEPVSRYAPDTPDQFGRLISQLLAKDPADRFPNVLVLSRHMEAMEKALSRSPKPNNEASSLQRDLPTNAGAVDATSHGADESTRLTAADQMVSPDTLSQAQSENLYDAPTLDQPSDAAAPSSGAFAAGEASPKTEQGGARFITVADEARRLREQAHGNHWLLAMQLGGLLGTLGALVWGGWYLMKPATADRLYETIHSETQRQGSEGLRNVEAEIEEFINRFPEDPRTIQLRAIRQQLEIQKYERHIHHRSRIVGADGLKPVERIYFDAMAVSEQQPARAQSMLQSLLALYDPEGKTAEYESHENHPDPPSDDEMLLIIVRRQVVRLDSRIKDEASGQLPALRERLDAAAKLQKSNPVEAKKMFQAIVLLYAEQPWAKEAVAEARRALRE